jgi:hypothetical protein
MTRTIQHFVSDEFGGMRSDILALGLSVFAAALLGIGRMSEGARAQTLETVSMEPLPPLQLAATARGEVLSALQSMDNRTLSLTYARIHSTFRQLIGSDDLSLARALIDYAALTEAELTRRAASRPPGTESAAEMMRLYELVL